MVKNKHLDQASPIGVYVHWPFCRHICSYCDYNIYQKPEVISQSFEDTYFKTLDLYTDYLQSRELVAIFFGGGTPSTMSPELVKKIINHIEMLAGQKAQNISMEANPDLSDIANFEAFAHAGIHRLSLGVQAFDNKSLGCLSRRHSVDDIDVALTKAHLFFKELSIDLMLGYPGQSLQDWEQTIECALSHVIDHYALYEFQSRAYNMDLDHHRFDEDMIINMFQYAQDLFEQNGFERYEFSHYAKNKHYSKYNMLVWQGHEYIGIGPGAHGRIRNRQNQWVAVSHEKVPQQWADQKYQQETRYHLDDKERLQEILLNGLRLKQGVNFNDIYNLTGLQPREYLHTRNLDDLTSQGYITKTTANMALTTNGLLLLDSIVPQILKNSFV